MQMRSVAAVLVAGSMLWSPGAAGAKSLISTGDGAWCAPATWLPPGLPEATDQVTIAAGHHVVLDGSCAQVAADLTVDGSDDPNARGTLSTVGGQTLTLGDPIAPYAVLNAGTIVLSGGDRLEVDCDAVYTMACEVKNAAGGLFVAHGVRMGSGVVRSVSGENCPANSDFLPDAPFHAADCTDVSVEVDGLGAVENDDPRFVGRYIRFGWPSAHRGTWYKIVGTSAPSSLVLDYNSEGQQAARGVGPATATSNATVAQGSTWVAWPGALSSADVNASLGAWFVCDDDCPAVSNDSPFIGASSERLPCASARRIVDASQAGQLALASGYPTQTCESGAPARIIGSSAGNGYSAVDYVERFAAGDPFVIWNPVTLTVPDANKQFSPTQSKTAGGLRVGDDSVVDLDGVRISFWGRGDSAMPDGFDPIHSQLTSTNTAGALYLRQVEIAHFGGGQAVDYKNIKNGLGANEDVTARDPLPTDQGEDPSRGHGLWLNQYDYPGGNGIAVIVGWRGIRLGDDCIVVNADSTSMPDTWDFARITLDHPTCTFGSTLGQRPSAQCFDFEDPGLKVRDGVDILAPMCSNYQNGGLAWLSEQTGATRSGRWLVSDGVFQNLEQPCMGTATNADYNAMQVLFVNSVCRGLPGDASSPGVEPNAVVGANVFSSYIADANRGIVDADVVKGAFVRLGYGASPTGLHTLSTAPARFTSSDQTYEDVAVQRPPCPTGLTCSWARGIDVGTNDFVTSRLTVTHGSFAGVAANKSGVAWQTSDNAAALTTVRDSIAWDVGILFSVQGAAANLTESYNLGAGFPTFCVSSGASCPPPSPTTLLSGGVAVQSLATGNLTPLRFTTPMTMATSDSTPAGARAAGPASWARLERVYPPLAALGRPGVRISGYAVDSDDDGLFDIHDDCPTVPLQRLLDPGTPGACAAIAAGCNPTLEGVPTSCGLGECASTGVCTNGLDTCVPGVPGAEICDGLDNDCNGLVDDADTDGDGVPDCVDNCMFVANPIVPGGPDEYLLANPWATLTGGQRDDDHDGYGNVCDGDFEGTDFTTSAADAAQFSASLGQLKAGDTCGTRGNRPCAFFDLNAANSTESSTGGISAADSSRFKALLGEPPGPKCPTCPLACRSGTAGSCF